MNAFSVKDADDSNNGSERQSLAPIEADDDVISIASTGAADCPDGARCWNKQCGMKHPPQRRLCRHEARCRFFACTFNHPPQRRRCCMHGAQCMMFGCRFLHPKERKQPCQRGAECRVFECAGLHPPGRPRPCKDGANCLNAGCWFWHPDSWKVCNNMMNCMDFDCKLLHHPNRPQVCTLGSFCWNPDCLYLHDPNTWNPCENGFECRGLLDKSCKKRHPPVSTHPLGSAAFTPPTPHGTRKKQALPILEARLDFLRRLQKERVLVVKAHTGSGKTTQLPQYCAETQELVTLANGNRGLVVCTQPRVIAAITIARRVAEEYDGPGHSPGESVGYKVGGAKAVAGSEIVFMTDAALIREYREHPNLEHISVLIVDEAHERSLNTDIVLGLAKKTLAKRTKDFFVVIASATIEEDLFLRFFGVQTRALEAGKAPHKVEVEYLQADELSAFPTERILREPIPFVKFMVVPKVLEVMKQHTQGHALVFLPGQAEIEIAIREISRQLPDDITPLPLYGSLPPEEQERVMKFDDRKDTMRMVAFCTNVAETSLTVHGVKLVIDSGLAKESRFDKERKITVLELQYISISSADQRKGRAGRECAGHCVRLYGDKTLTQKNSIPEIERCSLDDTVLQLVRIGENPTSFEFLQRPADDSIKQSLQLLTNLGCVENGTSKRC